MKKFKLSVLVTVFTVLCIVNAIAHAAFGMPSILDLTWTFERAVICLGDPGIKSGNNSFYVEGYVESWKDFENSDMIQIRIDGVTYLTHSSNVILISD